MAGVTAAGARRRVTALMFNGWSPAALAAETGLPEAVARQAVAGDAAAGWLGAIGEAYERLWRTPPPRRTEGEREAAELFAGYARTAGWAPPMAYDDDLIDSPEGDADPAVVRGTGPGRGLAHEALIEDIEFLREAADYRQATAAELAMRLGRSRDSVLSALSREAARQAMEAEQEREAG